MLCGPSRRHSHRLRAGQPQLAATIYRAVCCQLLNLEAWLSLVGLLPTVRLIGLVLALLTGTPQNGWWWLAMGGKGAEGYAQLRQFPWPEPKPGHGSS